MTLLRSFSIYTISSVLASALPVFLLPVLTRQLSESEYGVLATLTTLIALVTPPLFWGVTGAVSVEYHRQDAAAFRRYLSSALQVPIATFALLALSAWPLAWLISPRLGVPVPWLASVPVFVVLTLLPQVAASLMRMRNQPMQYAYLEIGGAVLAVVFTLVFVVWLDLHWQGRMAALAVSSLMTTVVALAWLLRQGYIVRCLESGYIRDALRFGAGLVPHDLGNQLIRLADRLFLVSMIGLAGAGQYAVAGQVASVMLVLLSAFNRAWAPFLFGMLKIGTDEAKADLVRKSYGVVLGFLLFFLAFNAATPWFYRLLIDPKFADSMPCVFWLTLGYLFMAVYLTYVDYIFYLKKTHLLSAITLVNMTANLVLNFVLIRVFGTVGAAMAFACTMAIVMVLAFLLSNRVYPMPWLFWLKRAA